MQSTALKWTAEENRRSIEPSDLRHPESNGPSFDATCRRSIGAKSPIASKARDERLLAICDGMTDLAAAMFNVSGRALRHPGKSSMAVSRVRQVAMYVTHVGLGISMREVGRGFSRDRTTVLYACHLVEDLRDEEEFDRMVAMFERVAKLAFGNA